MNGRKDILLIIPAYNEEKNIGEVLSKIKNLRLDLDCIVIDDGSGDSTCKIATQLGYRVLLHPFNMGYGIALHTGFKYALREGYKRAIIMDADGQHDPESIKDLIKKQNKTEADVIIGSRFLSSSGYRISPLKNFARRFLIFLIYIFLKKRFTDPTSGFQLLNRKVFEFLTNMDFPEDYPDADIVILIGLNGFRIEEISVVMKHRKSGRSIHGGVKPLYYGYKVLISVLSILINYRLIPHEKNKWKFTGQE